MVAPELGRWENRPAYSIMCPRRDMAGMCEHVCHAIMRHVPTGKQLCSATAQVCLWHHVASQERDRHVDKGGQPHCVDVTQNRDEHACPFPPVEALDDDSHTSTHFLCTAAGTQQARQLACLYWLNSAGTWQTWKCLPALPHAGTGHSCGVDGHVALSLGSARVRWG